MCIAQHSDHIVEHTSEILVCLQQIEVPVESLTLMAPRMTAMGQMPKMLIQAAETDMVAEVVSIMRVLME